MSILCKNNFKEDIAFLAISSLSIYRDEQYSSMLSATNLA